MYNLYYSPGTCSLATHVLLNELNQEVVLKTKDQAGDFAKINPALTVPVLEDDGKMINEGAAIALYLMEKHKSDFLPTTPAERQKSIQWMMFANASMHPAYSKLFFIGKNMPDSPDKIELLKKAGESVTKLWDVIESQLSKTKYISGNHVSMADVMLTVYSNWNNFFPNMVLLKEKSRHLVQTISQRPAFQKAVETEKIRFNV